MVLEDVLAAYTEHTHDLGPLPAVEYIKTRFPVGSFLMDEDGNVGLVTSHDLCNPPQAHGPMTYGNIMFIAPNGRLWSTDFLQLDEETCRTISRLEMLALAADRDTTELESLMRLAEVQAGKRG